MAKPSLSCLFILCILLLTACSGKPSKDDIKEKLLLDYVCGKTAEVNNLKIVKTEETNSTGGPHIFTYTIAGEVEWPAGCTENGSNTPPGTKERFNRLLTLYESNDGNWE